MQIIYELSVGNERLEVGGAFCGHESYQVAEASALPSSFLTGLTPEEHVLSCISGMQRENAALRQHVLDVRRASRAAGLDLNITSFLPIPVSPRICAVLLQQSCVSPMVLSPIQGIYQVANPLDRLEFGRWRLLGDKGTAQDPRLRHPAKFAGIGGTAGQRLASQHQGSGRC